MRCTRGWCREGIVVKDLVVLFFWNVCLVTASITLKSYETHFADHATVCAANIMHEYASYLFPEIRCLDYQMKQLQSSAGPEVWLGGFSERQTCKVTTSESNILSQIAPAHCVGI